MANSSLVRPAFPLHLESPCDSLFTSLEKIQALVDVATLASSSDSNCSARTIHNYIYAVSDYVEDARKAADELCKCPKGSASPKMDS